MQIFSWLFWIVISLTIAIWMLRGLEIITGISSGIIWVLLFLAIGLAAIARWQTPRRY